MSSPQSSPHANIPSPIKFTPYSKPSTPLKISIPFVNLTPEQKAALPIINLCSPSPTPSDMSPFIDLCTPANSPVEAPPDSPALSSATQKGPPPPIPTTPHPRIHYQESAIRTTVSNPPDFDIVMGSPDGWTRTKRRLPTPDTPTKAVRRPGHGIPPTSILPSISDKQINQSYGAAWTTGDTVACITQTSASPSPPQSCSPKIDYEKLAAKNLAAKKRPDGSYGGWVLPKMLAGVKRTTAEHAKPIYRPVQRVKEHPDIISEGYQETDLAHWNHNAPVSMLDLPYQTIGLQLTDKTSSFWVVT